MADSGEKVLYFFIGGFVGASVALLFAPKSGEETRNYLESKYRESSEKLSSKYREGSQKVEEKLREGRDYVDKTGRDLSHQFKEVVDRGKGTVNKQKEQLSSAIEAGKKAYHEQKSKLGADAGDVGSDSGVHSEEPAS